MVYNPSLVAGIFVHNNNLDLCLPKVYNTDAKYTLGK